METYSVELTKELGKLVEMNYFLIFLPIVYMDKLLWLDKNTLPTC